MKFQKREIIFWLLIATAIILTFKSLEANAETVQVCQNGKCLPETDQEVLQCVAQSCEHMAEGVYWCKEETCIDRPDLDTFKPRWAFNYSFAAVHYVAPGKDAPFPEHNGDPHGFGVEYHFSEELYLGINRFENSYYQDSTALTLGAVLVRSGYLQFGAEAGVANGYAIAGDTLKVPKITDDIIFVAGLVVRIGGPFAIKAVITPDFTAVQAQYLTGGAQ